MTEACQLTLSKDVFLLEERNFPEKLARDLAGRTITVIILPEEPPLTRQVGADDCPLLIDPVGNYWNDWRPTRVLFTDSEGRDWRLPREWLSKIPVSTEALVEAHQGISQKTAFAEAMNLPSLWDLWEINIPWNEAELAFRTRPTMVEVCPSPGEPAKVFWRGANGRVWRIPYNWRKRRVKLPEFELMVSQGIPNDVAEEYAGKIVSVNYHPGTLCCLPEQYRFRDSAGNRWPVLIRDCILVGLGDEIQLPA